VLDLYNYSLLTIFLAGLALIVAASEIGRFLGVRVGKQGGDNVSTLEAAVLGLLALMIGFTFAMALSTSFAERVVVRLRAYLGQAVGVERVQLETRSYENWVFL
jgi:uncharacterized membrane protein